MILNRTTVDHRESMGMKEINESLEEMKRTKEFLEVVVPWWASFCAREKEAEAKANARAEERRREEEKREAKEKIRRLVIVTSIVCPISIPAMIAVVKNVNKVD